MKATARFGPRLEPDGGVTFRLWAPAARRVELVLDGMQGMRSRDGGWHTLTVRDAGAGTLYQFRIDDELNVPDPASAFQPEDVHGPSEVIDHTYAWQAQDWRGRAWHEAVFLELHVGTFTPGGTFRSAIDKLDDVRDAGITAIELMPVAEFAGARNWGYDGVLLFAPEASYGRPEDLKALVDAAHQRGLMVFLDVVYNHFGPEGNFLGRYAPQFFTSAQTPWGSAIDYRIPEVRSFAVENVLHWLREYRFDGLRLDAVHAIVEPGEPSVLVELSLAAGQLAEKSGRAIHLVLENDDNRASLLDPVTDPARGKYRAQWNDDHHHAWHALLTGETSGYYRDYAQCPREHLARILSSGFAYQGEPSAHRKGAMRGEPSGALPPTAFVDFLQNHDQIGNRALGDRLTVLAPAPAIEAALAVTLLAPMPPLLFMGEEWGSTQPFPFFCNFSGELAAAVQRGRRAEFEEAYANLSGEWPDPLAPETFQSAVLDWAARDRAPHRKRLEFVRRLLEVRRAEILPLLGKLRANDAEARFETGVMHAAWRLAEGRQLLVAANLTGGSLPRPDGVREGRPIWGGPVPSRLPPWSVYWSTG
jgi:maltooligosyltrehalose trehalohydrolase